MHVSRNDSWRGGASGWKRRHTFKNMRTNRMLNLTRKPGETINIGDDITVTVLAVKDNQVKLGVNAPDDVKVFREEIYLRIQNENTPDDAA